MSNYVIAAIVALGVVPYIYRVLDNREDERNDRLRRLRQAFEEDHSRQALDDWLERLERKQ